MGHLCAVFTLRHWSLTANRCFPTASYLTQATLDGSKARLFAYVPLICYRKSYLCSDLTLECDLNSGISQRSAEVA